MRYIYSVVRFVPDPVRGEFINVGALVGSDEASEWRLQMIDNLRRARYLDDRSVLPAVWHVVDDIGRRIAAFEESIESGTGARVEMSEQWLDKVFEDYRNIVQFSPPTPIVAESAEEAIDVVWQQFIVDPESRALNFKKKPFALAALRRAYSDAEVRRTEVAEGAVVQGLHHRERFDFAVLNGQVVQLAHAWSFQIPRQEQLAEDIKAWAWTVQDIRKTGGAVQVGHDAPHSVNRDVDVEVVYIPPAPGASRAVLNEALSAFREVQAQAVEVEAAIQVGRRARNLLGGTARPRG